MTVLQGRTVCLRRIRYADIERLRQWRNSSELQQYHIYRGEITVAEQKEWFAKIDSSSTDFFFMIEKNRRQYGVTKLQNIDWDTRKGETGIFITAPEDRNSFIAVEAALLLVSYSFNHLHLHSVAASALVENRQSISFIERLGFQLFSRENRLIGNTCEAINHYRMTLPEFNGATMHLQRKFADNLLKNSQNTL